MLEVAVSQQDGGVDQGSVRGPEKLSTAETTQRSLRGLPIVAKVPESNLAPNPVSFKTCTSPSMHSIMTLIEVHNMLGLQVV